LNTAPGFNLRESKIINTPKHTLRFRQVCVETEISNIDEIK